MCGFGAYVEPTVLQLSGSTLQHPTTMVVKAMSMNPWFQEDDTNEKPVRANLAPNLSQPNQTTDTQQR